MAKTGKPNILFIMADDIGGSISVATTTASWAIARRTWIASPARARCSRTFMASKAAPLAVRRSSRASSRSARA